VSVHLPAELLHSTPDVTLTWLGLVPVLPRTLQMFGEHVITAGGHTLLAKVAQGLLARATAGGQKVAKDDIEALRLL
jgi:hypothetical protein